jgi:hypothetical protein
LSAYRQVSSKRIDISKVFRIFLHNYLTKSGNFDVFRKRLVMRTCPPNFIQFEKHSKIAFSAHIELHTIQLSLAIQAKTRTSQPKVIPLVAKGLNAGKYPGVCVPAWNG